MRDAGCGMRHAFATMRLAADASFGAPLTDYQKAQITPRRRPGFGAGSKFGPAPPSPLLWVRVEARRRSGFGAGSKFCSSF